MAGFVSIQAEVLSRLGNRADLTSRIPIWINDAYFELIMSPRFGFYAVEATSSFSTSIGINTYGLPAYFWYIIDVILDTASGTRIKLRRVSPTEIDRTTSTSGQPYRYAHFGLAIQLDPVPDAAYLIGIRAKIRPNELSSTNTDTVIGREWDEVITKMAVIKGYEALDQRDKAAELRTILEDDLARRLDVPNLEDIDSEPTLAPVIGNRY